jgi:hypothetical protein
MKADTKALRMADLTVFFLPLRMILVISAFIIFHFFKVASIAIFWEPFPRTICFTYAVFAGFGCEGWWG